MPEFPTIRQVAAFLERWAPPESAQSYDNVGLQVGDPDQHVERALTALDMTAAVLEEAVDWSASLIITHHPLLFRPLRRLTTDSPTASLAYRLASEGIGLYSIHTNLDAASGGVSFALGRQLGLLDLEFLQVFAEGDGDTGFGAVGRLEEPVPLEAFLQRVAERLGSPGLRYVGDPAVVIERVAVCGGAGSDLVGAAAESGADAFVTADVKYHDFFAALHIDGHPRIAFVDAGHYETEVVTETLLAGELEERFPEASWRATSTRTSPVRTFVAKP